MKEREYRLSRTRDDDGISQQQRMQELRDLMRGLASFFPAFANTFRRVGSMLVSATHTEAPQ